MEKTTEIRLVLVALAFVALQNLTAVVAEDDTGELTQEAFRNDISDLSLDEAMGHNKWCRVEKFDCLCVDRLVDELDRWVCEKDDGSSLHLAVAREFEDSVVLFEVIVDAAQAEDELVDHHADFRGEIHETEHAKTHVQALLRCYWQTLETLRWTSRVDTLVDSDEGRSHFVFAK